MSALLTRRRARVASMVVLQQRWRAQAAMLRAVRAGDLSLLVRLLDSDLGLDCDMAFSIGGAERPAICLALEQVSGLLVLMLTYDKTIFTGPCEAG